jgi:hypothetical protein
VEILASASFKIKESIFASSKVFKRPIPFLVMNLTSMRSKFYEVKGDRIEDAFSQEKYEKLLQS